MPGRPAFARAGVLTTGIDPAQWVPAIAVASLLCRELLWLTAAAIFLSGLDDLCMDMFWLAGRSLHRPPVPPPLPERPFRHAILIPAWDESAVIAPMLCRLTATLKHGDYRIFVGVYPNDPATRTAVETVRDQRILLIETSRPGPTTKADCLNHLWRAVRAHEEEQGQRFDSIVLHDAEDVVHPAELSLFDRYLPQAGMLQLPVLPLVDYRSRWISGHYLDEFAQSHGRDMMVRSWLGVPLPSAGVATALRRDVMDKLAQPHDEPFDSSSLTEDYEIGHRLHQMGHRGLMLRVHEAGQLVATREYFPATLETALRQKSRWLTGITLMGWDRIGWQGGLMTRWFLARDRKGLFTATIAVIGYATAALLLALMLILSWMEGSTGTAIAFPLPEDPALLLLLEANALLLMWRMGWRSFFSWREHGAVEGLRAIPRAAVGNVINFLAALRAVASYRTMLTAGTPPVWNKTMHRFPGAGDPVIGVANG